MTDDASLCRRRAPVRLASALPIRRLFGAICAIVFLAGCETTYPTRAVDSNAIVLDRPSIEIPEDLLLGVRIHPFDPGEIPEAADEARGISQEIRNAEGYYVAVQLKKAMERSGHWGPVRVVPGANRGGELVVKGRIEESDSEVLRLAVSVHDSTGSRWMKKEYQRVVDINDYNRWESGVEAFQPLYNEIANDIAERRHGRSPKEIAEIRQVAELKFAKDFAPSAFQGFLSSDDTNKEFNTGYNLSQVFTGSEDAVQEGTVSVVRLPADDDPMLQRIRKIRARDELLVDTLDLQYEELYRAIGGAYTQWRIARLNEINAVRDREDKRDDKIGQAIGLGLTGIILGVAIGAAGGKNCRSCGTAGGVIAGVAASTALDVAIRAAEEAEQDTEIHKAALEELGQSLAADLELTVVEIEGETIELQGTADAKYQQWREILREIYEREVGVPSVEDANVIGTTTN